MYDEKRGVLVSGRDIIQWMVYHLRMPSDEETVVYLKRVAQEFINQRYIMRCSNSLLPAMFRHRKNRVNMKFSGGNKLYDFNDVSVSRLHVVVLIQGASGLMARDRSGTSDPVCQVLLGGTQSRQTRVISKNCYPIWNEVFTFGVRDVSAQQLVFKIYDYDVTSSDDFLGYARLPLSDILSESDLKQMRLQKMHEERQLSRMHRVQGGRTRGGRGSTRSPSMAGINGLPDFLTKRGGARRDEVAANLGNFGDGSLKGAKALIHDVNLLFDDGAFEGAMKTLKLADGGETRGLRHKAVQVKGTLRVGAFLRDYHPRELEMRDDDDENDEALDYEYGDDGVASAPATQKFQLYRHVYHARGIKARRRPALATMCLA